MKVTQNEKRKKLLGFSFNINIANSEEFLWNLNLSTNCLFWGCGLWHSGSKIIQNGGTLKFNYKTIGLRSTCKMQKKHNK